MLSYQLQHDCELVRMISIKEDSDKSRAVQVFEEKHFLTYIRTKCSVQMWLLFQHCTIFVYKQMTQSCLKIEKKCIILHFMLNNKGYNLCFLH